jgi:hypothetical protein
MDERDEDAKRLKMVEAVDASQVWRRDWPLPLELIKSGVSNTDEIL